MTDEKKSTPNASPDPYADLDRAEKAIRSILPPFWSYEGVIRDLAARLDRATPTPSVACYNCRHGRPSSCENVIDGAHCLARRDAAPSSSLATRDEALEECAAIADRHVYHVSHPTQMTQGRNEAARGIAADIRALRKRSVTNG